MQNCLYQGKELNLLELSYEKGYEEYKENELLLRKASKLGKLRCIDCGSILTYRSSEIVTAHFAHKKGTLKDCPYSEYTKSQTEKLRQAKKILFDHFKHLFPEKEIKVEKMIDNKLRSDILIDLGNNSPLAVDYILRIDPISMDTKNTYYRENNIKNLWILDISNKRIYKKESDMDLVKRIILNETVNSILIFLDTHSKEVCLLKTAEIQWKGTFIFEKNYKIIELNITEEGKLRMDFEDLFLQSLNKRIKMMNVQRFETPKISKDSIFIDMNKTREDRDLSTFNFNEVLQNLENYKIDYPTACKLLYYIKTKLNAQEHRIIIKNLYNKITRTLGRTPKSDLRNVLVDIEIKLESMSED